MFKYFKDIVGPIYLPFRHPFKTIQRALSIQEEWKQTKSILRPHKYKLLFLTGIRFLNSDKTKGFIVILGGIITWSAYRCSHVKFPKVFKQTIQEVLRDQQVQRESVLFVDRLSKQQQVQDAIVILLKDSLQHPLFHDESQIFIKQLGLELLKDKEIEKHLVELLIRMVNDVEVKYELKELFKWAATQDDVKDAVILVLKNTGEDPRFRQSLSESLSYAVNDVLMRKETSERFKMFAYYLLESEAKSGQGIKGVIDLIVQKAIKKKTESSKNGEFDRIMKGLVGNEGLNDLNENRQQFNSKNDKNPQY